MKAMYLDRLLWVESDGSLLGPIGRKRTFEVLVLDIGNRSGRGGRRVKSQPPARSSRREGGLAMTGIICQLAFYLRHRSIDEAICMPTRNVVLTDQQAELVEELVRSGRYQNASEVLRDGLRLLQRREAEESAKLEALRGALDEAEAAIVAGEIVDYTPTLLDEIDEQERERSRLGAGA